MSVQQMSVQGVRFYPCDLLQMSSSAYHLVTSCETGKHWKTSYLNLVKSTQLFFLLNVNTVQYICSVHFKLIQLRTSSFNIQTTLTMIVNMHFTALRSFDLKL